MIPTLYMISPFNLISTRAKINKNRMFLRLYRNSMENELLTLVFERTMKGEKRLKLVYQI